jgi:electron transfer flavoprotein alpha subunit
MAVYLVFVEQRSGTAKSSAAELVSTARGLAGAGGEVHATLFGTGAGGAAAALGPMGADKVHVAEDPALDAYSAEAWTAALAQLIHQLEPDVVLASGSPTGRDFLPRVASAVGGGLAADCTELRSEGDRLIATRPLYAGKVLADATVVASPQIFSLRPNAFGVAQVASGAGEVVAYSPELEAVRSQVVERQSKGSGRPDLQSAEIIVSGGRAMGSAENFAVLEPVADALGAAIGASRAAVDSGYASHDMQVGQTGKTVNPKLYIACGISGAIQHLAGMRTSKVIVAINKDPEAPIFQHATYGIVADLFEAAPMLAEELKALAD